MSVSNLPKYWNSSNIGSPYLLQPSRWLSPEVNKFFGTGAIDSSLDGLIRKVFPNLPHNPGFVRNHGIQDAVELSEMFNKGKLHVDLGNLERGRAPVTNSAVWGLDNWNNPRPQANIAKHIYDTSNPDYSTMNGNYPGSYGVDFGAPFMGKFSALRENDNNGIIEKGQFINKNSPKIAALLKKAKKTIEKNKKNELLLPAIGAAAGGTMPLASLAQYWLNDYGKIRDKIENVPIFDGKELHKQLKPGDIGTSGYVNYKKFHPLADGSRYTTGNPAGHGFGVGKYKKIYHAGALGGHLIDIPERYQVDGGSATVADRLGNILHAAGKFKNSKDKNLLRRMRRAWGHVSGTDRIRKKLLTRVNQGSMKGAKPHKKLDSLPRELAMEHANGEDIFTILFRNKKLTSKQKTQMLQKMEKSTVLPYSVAEGASAGASRVLLPKTRGKTETSCTGTMCGDNIGAAHSVTGKGYKGRAMPVDVFLDPDFVPVGAAASKNMSEKQLRKVMLGALQDAAKKRTLLGLGGAGVGMGLGAGAGILGNSLETKLRQIFQKKPKD